MANCCDMSELADNPFVSLFGSVEEVLLFRASFNIKPQLFYSELAQNGINIMGMDFG